MNRNYGIAAAFAAGLGAIAWVAYGYFGSHPLALTITSLIAAFYLLGAVELHRFRQATTSLRTALAALPDGPLPSLGDWLATLHPSLRNAVRLRIEGERAGLPGPSMTPYLVGLLVLLGMLGTFLGMVVTLNGAVLALESTTDLATIRAALAAPIKGLGLAFGTSIAGVAASAMLGLVSTLCRRERLLAALSLDTRIATSLRVFSLAHQREQTLESLQLQARLMPGVVEKMQAMMAQMERHNESLGERLLADQQRFYQHAQTAYADLASSVDHSLKHSLSESARLAGATITPVVEATMAGISRETAALQEKMSATVQQQLDGLARRFDTTVTTVADGWTGALARHDGRSEALVSGLHASLAGFNGTFERHAASLLASVDDRQAASQRAMANVVTQMAQQAGDQHTRLADASQLQLEAVAQRFGVTTASAAQSWRDALAQQQLGSENLSGAMQTAVTSLVESFEFRSAALLETVGQAHVTLQADLAGSDQHRLAAWTTALEGMAESLRDETQRAGAQSLAQQQQICTTLEQTARDVLTQAAEQARETIGVMERLIETACEAPRAAAQVVGEMREKLSDSMVRDKGMLEERSRIMATLGSLLDAVNQAATEQRDAIDALVASAATMLERAGAQFGDRIDHASEKVEAVAAQASGSAVDMASMGEAFGVAVQLFGASSEALTGQLQRIEAALGKSNTRSDEQLAYYVAQAREIVDLSMSSQKQIVDDLQQLAIRQMPMASEVA